MSDEPRAGAVLFAKDMHRIAAFYSSVLGFEAARGDDDHVVLESPAFQLVVHRIPGHIASTIQVTSPPVRRARAAVKLVFFVRSLSHIRAAAEAHGGIMNGADQEWDYNGWRVCDGLDPEGNVVQFRARPS